MRTYNVSIRVTIDLLIPVDAEDSDQAEEYALELAPAEASKEEWHYEILETYEDHND